MVFSDNCNNLIDDSFQRVKKLTNHSKDITNQRFGKLIALFPLICRRGGKTNHSIFWVCRCDCGTYYRIIANKLYNNKIKCCPNCNDHVMTNDGIILYPRNHTATKTDAELINILADKYYNLVAELIELEDFKQELGLIFHINRLKGRSRTYTIENYLRDLICRLRNHSKHPIKYVFDSYENIEIIEENMLDYLDIYPQDKTLKIYLDRYLTDKEKQVIKYIYWYRLPITQISNIMNITTQRVSQIHHSGLKKLTTKFKGGALKMDCAKYKIRKEKRNRRIKNESEIKHTE